MNKIAQLGVRRPKIMLSAWALVLVASLFFYRGARDNLHETNLQIPGTAADKATKLSEQQFGGSLNLAILLRDRDGDAQLVRRQGQRLIAQLQAIEGVEVLSPFAQGADPELSQPPGQALLAIQINRSQKDITNEVYPRINDLVQQLPEPIEANISGRTPLVHAINDASLESLDRGELIAVPILIILLLLVFRSPMAAAIPLGSGLLTVVIGTAAMQFLNDLFELDALALNMLTMIGLALGVDYSLLMVSRFREELENGLSRGEAVVAATVRAGRTVLFAGTALVTGMLGALWIAPGSLLISATLGVIVACLVAVGAALLAIPAALGLLGDRVNALSFRFGSGQNLWVRFSERMSRKPGLAVLVSLIPLAILATPAVALDTGPPNVANLPADNPARQSYQAFERERGAGWSTPYEVLFKADGPIAIESRLRELARYQRRVARIKEVEAVFGPAALLDYVKGSDSPTRNFRTVLRQRDQVLTNVGFAINLGRGGDTARVIVVPASGPFASGQSSLRHRLERETDSTAERMGARGVVGGPAVLLDDFDRVTSARFPWLVLTLVVVTFLVLLAVFRAPVLALIAVLLNLVTVGAATGVLVVLFQFNDPLVGGPGYLDAIALSGIFAIVFGLSIDYEVFLISRLVEGRTLTGTTDGAIRYGLEKTATIITGAAAIMAFVFLAFAESEVANTRQFGIGLTVAVALDATAVRLILLPALVRMFGERTWATPAVFDRVLPRLPGR